MPKKVNELIFQVRVSKDNSKGGVFIHLKGDYSVNCAAIDAAPSKAVF